MTQVLEEQSGGSEAEGQGKLHTFTRHHIFWTCVYTVSQCTKHDNNLIFSYAFTI